MHGGVESRQASTQSRYDTHFTTDDRTTNGMPDVTDVSVLVCLAEFLQVAERRAVVFAQMDRRQFSSRRKIVRMSGRRTGDSAGRRAMPVVQPNERAWSRLG